MSIFGILCLLGVVIGAAVLPRMSDFYGRLRLTQLGSLINFLSLLILVLFPNSFEVGLTAMFGLGVGYAGRGICGYVWMSEFLTEKSLTLASGIIFFVDGLALAMGACYFWFISKDWVGLMMFSCIGTTIVMIVMFTCACKTPKWLQNKGHLDEANEVLTLIGRTNGTL